MKFLAFIAHTGWKVTFVVLKLHVGNTYRWFRKRSDHKHNEPVKPSILAKSCIHQVARVTWIAHKFLYWIVSCWAHYWNEYCTVYFAHKLMPARANGLVSSCRLDSSLVCLNANVSMNLERNKNKKHFVTYVIWSPNKRSQPSVEDLSWF